MLVVSYNKNKNKINWPFAELWYVSKHANLIIPVDQSLFCSGYVVGHSSRNTIFEFLD